jgi:hypothetical protein
MLNGTAQRPRRIESAAASLWEPQISKIWSIKLQCVCTWTWQCWRKFNPGSGSTWVLKANCYCWMYSARDPFWMLTLRVFSTTKTHKHCVAVNRPAVGDVHCCTLTLIKIAAVKETHHIYRKKGTQSQFNLIELYFGRRRRWCVYSRCFET